MNQITRLNEKDTVKFDSLSVGQLCSFNGVIYIVASHDGVKLIVRLDNGLAYAKDGCMACDFVSLLNESVKIQCK